MTKERTVLTMPDWLWVLALFVFLTFGYCVGFATGSYKHDPDKPPTENAYIRESEINAAAWERVELRKAELEQQASLERYRIAAEKVTEQEKQKGEQDGNVL